MGSDISILNDTLEPVTIYFTLRGGGSPAKGNRKQVVQVGKENKQGFTLSLAITIVAEYTPPGGRMITKSLDVFTPALDGHQDNYNCSQLLGHIPGLKLGRHDTKWREVYSLENTSATVEPSIDYTTSFGFTDTKGNSEMTSFGLKISAEATFKKVFGVSVEQTFGAENKVWIEQSLVKKTSFVIKIPQIPPHTTVRIYQKAAEFDVSGEFSDTFRVTSKVYKIEEDGHHDQSKKVRLIHHDGNAMVRSYPKVNIINSTDKNMKIKVYYALRSHDEGLIEPWGSWTGPGRGVCLLTKVEATVTVNNGEYKVQPYTSTGTSYSQFAVLQTDEKSFQVTRRVH